MAGARDYTTSWLELILAMVAVVGVLLLLLYIFTDIRVDNLAEIMSLSKLGADVSMLLSKLKPSQTMVTDILVILSGSAFTKSFF